MSETAVVYGYKLGGPRKWNLTGFRTGDELIVSWYDERNPIHDFPECAVREIITGGRPITDRKVLAAREAALPFWFDEAIELSPPDWIRGRDWDPNPVSMLPVDAPARQLDRPALSEYVLYVHDSFQEIEYEPCYDDPDGELPGEGASLDFRIDWDSLLDGALAELGLRASHPGLVLVPPAQRTSMGVGGAWALPGDVGYKPQPTHACADGGSR